MDAIRVPEKELSVLYDVDVCVVGGGSAGVATAAAAACNGANTLLIERLSHLGGTTTNAMVCIWHLSDGKKQVCKGVAQGLVDEYVRIDAGNMRVTLSYPDEMGDPVDKSHEFRNEIMKHAMERYVVDAGVTPLYYTDVNDVIMDGGRMEALVISTKRGNAVVRAKFFADCTGDGNVAVSVRARYEQGRSEDKPLSELDMRGTAAQTRCAGRVHRRRRMSEPRCVKTDKENLRMIGTSTSVRLRGEFARAFPGWGAFHGCGVGGERKISRCYSQ